MAVLVLDDADVRALPASAAVDSARRAVADVDVVILATRAGRPVIDADDVSRGTHVVTVGPKTVDAHETPSGLADRAALITCDSPAQARGYGASFFIDDHALVHLGDVVSGVHPGRRDADDITLHCSVGLAGTEVLLADAVMRAAGSREPPRQ